LNQFKVLGGAAYLDNTSDDCRGQIRIFIENMVELKSYLAWYSYMFLRLRGNLYKRVFNEFYGGAL